MNPEIRINESLAKQKNILMEFIDFYHKGLDYETMIYKLWNAKQVLGHVTFWHESFARNISDVANNRKPNPLKGKLSDVNILSVSTMSQFTIEELCGKIIDAQEIIEMYIFDDEVELIPYKRGSRPYSRMEHLEIVASHIKKHLADMQCKIRK